MNTSETAIHLILIAALLFAVGGCGSSGAPDAPSDDSTSADDTSSATPPSEGRLVAEKEKDVQPASIDPDSDSEPTFPATLAIGDKAPQIYLSQFYTGEAVGKIEPGRVHVIEFWATWCPPCRTSMPHLSSLQSQYADQVTVIGITDEGQDKVGPFLGGEAQDGKTWDEVVNYRLAQDREGWTNKSYMTPSGQTGIPSAFIVGKDGFIEWIGHPMQMDDPLAKVVDGTWNREEGAMLVAAQKQLQQAMRSGDTDQALAALAKMEEASPSESMTGVRFQILLQAERYEEAKAAVAKCVDDESDEALLNMMAWNVAVKFPEEHRDLDVALKAAQKASELTDDNASPILDTLARVHYERGEFQDAVAWQEKAVLYGDKGEYQDTLDRYKDEKDKPDFPESLTIGDPAPAVYASQWFTGEAIESFEDDKVYVVEFWATWCPPCRTSMPHLSSLQDEYGDDVVFIGITKEGEDVVGPFMKDEAQGQDGKTWEEVVTYRLAKDRHEWTSQSYMTAAKQTGIPSAFIIGKGKDKVVEWIGHPMRMDQPLKEIVSGDWDRAAAVEKAAKEARVQDAMAAVRAPLVKAQRAGDWDTVVELLSGVEDELGDDAKELAGMKFQFLSRAKKYNEALAIAKKFADGDSEDSSTLNMVSWEIATAFPEEARDLDVALKLAQNASAMEDDQSPQVIDTLARVHFEMGDVDRAIEWQSKAVELGGNAYEKALEEFKAAKESAENPPAEDASDEDAAEDSDGTGEAA